MPAGAAGSSATSTGKVRMSTAHLREQPRPSAAGKHLKAPALGSGIVDPVPAEPLEWLDEQDWLDELLDDDEQDWH